MFLSFGTTNPIMLWVMQTRRFGRTTILLLYGVAILQLNSRAITGVNCPDFSKCVWYCSCVTLRGSGATYIRAIVDSQGLQGPGETKPHQDVKHVAADGVGHRHVSHSWTDRQSYKAAETKGTTGKERYRETAGEEKWVGDRKVHRGCGGTEVGWYRRDQ